MPRWSGARRVAVFADETRPFLQGARLTAWELVRDGIDTTVITESMAGPLMRAGEIDLVVVGADRIAANGDTANKIGTYTVAVLAREHKVPFYVAAPLSTVDLATPDGDKIPIEERDRREVTHLGSSRLTPEGAHVRNPGVRRDPAPLHHRHHHREGHLRAAVQREPERGLRRRHSVSVNLLAIETSCDETAAALVAETGDPARPWRVRSSIVASQTAIHREWGGVVPELASRQHVRDICGVVEAALAQAGAQTADVGAVAVTQGPGLVGSLLVGVAFAKAFAWARGLPVIPVHHLAGHIESLTLAHGELPLPAAVLVVSGGHTSLYLVPEPGVYRLIGRTRDDAAGEAYDKVAKLLGLGYPGGPVIDRLAREGREDRFSFPVTRLTHADRNAPARHRLRSAAGRRGAAHRLQLLRAQDGRPAARAGAHGRPRAGRRRCRQRTSRTSARAFSASWSRRLLERTFEAARWLGARSVGIAGGVSANSRLRADAEARGARAGLPVFVPPIALSTDNAAMIGAAGLRRYRAGVRRHVGVQRRSVAAAVIMKTFTDYLWFTTKQRQEFIRITDEVSAIVKKSGVDDGMVLVSAMHITAGVYVNDWEDGLIADFQTWLEKLAPAGLPYKHHQTGEDNADAHLKRTIMGHQVMVPITDGKLDLGPWEQIFYAEFDGQQTQARGCEGDGDLRGHGSDSVEPAARAQRVIAARCTRSRPRAHRDCRQQRCDCSRSSNSDALPTVNTPHAPSSASAP